MALPTLNWKKIGPYDLVGTTDIPTILDGIYDMFTTYDYYDGTTRTPGSGSAWTCSRYQNGGTTEALYFTPPSVDIPDFRVIVAGVGSGAYTPTMDLDPHANGNVMVGMNKESGAFNAWDNALPFTSGVFSGYNNWLDPNNSAHEIKQVWAIESQEGLTIWAQYENHYIKGFVVGALIDPNSDNPIDIEPDGRIYSLVTGGTSYATSFSPAADCFIMSDNATNDLHHFRTWLGGTSVKSRSLTSRIYTTPGNWYQLPSGKMLLIPANAYRFANGDTYIGRWREVFFIHQAYGMSTAQEGGSDLGHYYAERADSSGHAILFKA